MPTDDHPNKAFDFGVFARNLATITSASAQEAAQWRELALLQQEPPREVARRTSSKRAHTFLERLQEGRELWRHMNTRPNLRPLFQPSSDEIVLFAFLFDPITKKALVRMRICPHCSQVRLALPKVHVLSHNPKSSPTIRLVKRVTEPHTHLDATFWGAIGNTRLWLARAPGGSRRPLEHEHEDRWADYRVLMALLNTDAMIDPSHEKGLDAGIISAFVIPMKEGTRP